MNSFPWPSAEELKEISKQGGLHKWMEECQEPAGNLHKVTWYRVVLDEAWVSCYLWDLFRAYMLLGMLSRILNLEHRSHASSSVLNIDGLVLPPWYPIE